MGPLYGLPRGTQPAGVNDFLERIVHPDDRAALGRLIEDARARWDRVRVRPAGRAARPWRALAAHPRARRPRSGRPDRAHHRAAQRRHRAPPARGGARVPGRREPGAGRVDGPDPHAPGGRPARRPAAGRLVRGAARGTGEQPAVAHIDPDKVRWARELQERYPPDPDAPTGAPERDPHRPPGALPDHRRHADGGRGAGRGATPARPRTADELGDGGPADRPRPHARRDDVRVGRVRAPVHDPRARAGRWSSAAAPGSRSTTRGCSRASTP